MFESKTKSGIATHTIEEYEDLFRLSYIYFISSFVLGFFLSFNDWGVGDEIDINTGAMNFLISSLIVLVVLVFHHVMMLYEARKHGAKLEVGLWPIGILASIVVSFFTSGRLIFPMMFLERISAGFQIGKKASVRLTPTEKSQIASMGLMSFVILLFLSRMVFDGFVGEKLFIVSAFFIIFNCIPLYHNLNLYIFTGAKTSWAFVVPFAIGSVLFFYFVPSLILAAVLSFSCAFVIWVLYHYYHEHYTLEKIK